MDEHYADKSGVRFSEVSPIYVEFTQRFHRASIWWRPRYLTLDLGLGTVLALCCLWSLELNPNGVHTDMVQTHRPWVTHAEVPQFGVTF